MLIYSLNIKSQSVAGKIIDIHQNPLQYVSVALYSQKDTTFIKGKISDHEGNFDIPIEDDGVYILKISAVGYEPIVTSCISDVEARPVYVMEPISIDLNGATVEASRPSHILTHDGIKTIVKGSILSNLGTVEDVLLNIPGIIKKDDDFEIFGKGVPLIYIDGRMVRDLSELTTLKSDDINFVEIINNPGAKYSASATSVIRIETLKKEDERWGLHFQKSYKQSKVGSSSDYIEFHLKSKKMRFWGLVNYNANRNIEDSEAVQEMHTDTVWIHSYQLHYKSVKKNILTTLGGHYSPNSNHEVGLRYRTRFHIKDAVKGTFLSDVTANQTSFDHFNNLIYIEKESIFPQEINVYYLGKVKKFDININSDNLFNREKEQQKYEENSDKNIKRFIRSINKIENSLFALKFSLSTPLYNGKLSFGSEFILTNRNETYANEDLVGLDGSIKSKENHVSPFIEYSRTINSTTIQCGLRYELVSNNYDLKESVLSRSYKNFFPNLSIMRHFGGVNVILNYSSKIKRPPYAYLTNGKTYINQFTLQTGNPQLEPTFIHNIALKTSWRFVNASIDYSLNKNAIINWAYRSEYADNKNVSLLTYRNIKILRQLQAMVSVSPKIHFWHPDVFFGIKKDFVKIHTKETIISPKEPIFMFQFYNKFAIKKDFSVMLNISFVSRGEFENVILQNNIINTYIGLNKTLYKGRLNLKIIAQNIVHKTTQKFGSTNQNIYINQKKFLDSRKVELTLQYNLNKKYTYKGKTAGQSEIERL